ncbi:helix-turn-helix domain-containing protein [Mucilaginibacter sp. 44-25]|uniref:helix-turn-helix domain-containing protein n=1 Tax=Mucilaginibacter sp. 44-25 TaxID=1895794 RepID=UPI000961FBAE|nr:helix-turn-helix domain-containing protein [Mucilaginibacter sp. 44-25]OJW12515.1 MAG: DNA-binding protein [Mucilaginibacter sp. 44-25]
MEVICFEDRAFYALIDKLEAYIDSKKPQQTLSDKWISGAEAMNMMRIKSKTTLQKLRDEGKIRFTQPEKKIVLYDRDSINAYLEDFTYETF